MMDAEAPVVMSSEDFKSTFDFVKPAAGQAVAFHGKKTFHFEPRMNEQTEYAT